MLTIEIPVSVDLRDLSNLPGRVQSVYFRRPLGDESTAARRHAVVTRLAEQGVGASGLRAVDDALCDVRPGRGAVALFLGDDGEHRLLSMPGAQTADSADWSALPNLLPLLAWRQASPAYVLAVLDREGAELTVQPAFGGRPDTVRVSGPDDEVCGNAPSGRPQDRFQRRIEDSRQHNADRGAAAAAEALKTSGARLLLVAGDAHTVGLFTDRLPAWVAQEADVRRVGGGRSHDGAPGSRTDRDKAAVR
ncbi:MAG: hypothetical protein HOW97_01855, partial [Catenulispora sp.]|nr:hypothetical protein [Catenulispora sp.]